MTIILQNGLPTSVQGDPRLPGTGPCAPNDWLQIDDAYAAQMRYRSALLAERSKAVLYDSEATHEPNCEVLEEALKLLPGLGFAVTDTHVTCPDRRRVMIDWDAPLRTLGHLVQEDICVLQKRGAEHVLTGAVLCFPAGWRLEDKINQPLTHIHVPVASYDANIAARVQRLFDGVQVGKPLWRFNKLRYADADLHQPYKQPLQGERHFVRSERQCILRLPRTNAVVFTIHTYVVRGT